MPDTSTWWHPDLPQALLDDLPADSYRRVRDMYRAMKAAASAGGWGAGAVGLAVGGMAAQQAQANEVRSV